MSKPLGSSPANTTFAFFMSVILVIASAFAPQGNADDSMLPESQAFRAGLKVQWNTQLPVGAPFKLIDWYLHIDENSSTTYFVMEAGTIREVVSNRQLNNKGEPFGIQGAKEEIDFRKELLETRLKLRGIKDIEVKISSYTLPKSVLYLLTSDGVVTAMDADTGNILWDQLIGDMTLTVVGVGAGNKHVAVIVGSKVYCLDSEDGRTLWSKETVYVPSASPAVSETNILVPLGNGRLQSFLIEKGGYGSNAYFASGVATSRPLVTGSRVAWSTDSGQLNLATPTASKAVSYRLKANDAILAEPTGRGPLVYAASVDGFVYCIDQEKGRLVWETTTGSTVTQPAIPIGDFLYVVSQTQQLFKVDALTGQFSENWDTPVDHIRRFLGASEKKIFALDNQNNLEVIDDATGKVLSSVSVGTIDQVLTNYQTDRMYLATNNGAIQCVRGATSENPVFFNSDKMAAADGSSTKPADGAGSATKDPFATGENVDPFGTDNKAPAGEEKDPFADDDESGSAPKADNSDPFGSPADDDDGNPFN